MSDVERRLVTMLHDWHHALTKFGQAWSAVEDLIRAADMIEKLSAELGQVRRERDAAIESLNVIIPISRHCGLCLYNGGAEQCKIVDGCCGGTWRGPCEENGGLSK